MPLCQNESSYKAFRVKMALICMKMNRNGFAQRLVLSQRHKGNLEMGYLFQDCSPKYITMRAPGDPNWLYVHDFVKIALSFKLQGHQL